MKKACRLPYRMKMKLSYIQTCNFSGFLTVFVFLLLVNGTLVFDQSARFSSIDNHVSFSGKKHANKKLKQSLNFKLKNLNRFAQKKLLALNVSFSSKEDLPLSLFLSDKPPVIVTEDELSRKSHCSFLGADCPLEIIEHQLVSKFIAPLDVVLELGGRFGTTSCHIARQQRNSGKLVVVEPDKNVEFILKYNQFIHSCSFWTFNGLISNSSSYVVQAGSYDTRTMRRSDSESNLRTVNESVVSTISFEKLQELLNLQFTAILIDCEGCIQQLFQGSLDILLKTVKTILLEADMSTNSHSCASNCVDYRFWIKKFIAAGFTVVHRQTDNAFPDIGHYVLKRQ
jgi:FkbM family methyltransferase